MKKSIYLFVLMMAIVLSFASCSSDDENEDDQPTGSTVVERCENGAVINRSYYLFPCCQWGLSVSAIKSKMSSYTLEGESTEPDVNNSVYISYYLDNNKKEYIKYVFTNGKLSNVMYESTLKM